MNFSYSRISTYKQCPFKYKRNYIEGVTEEKFAFDLGSIAHKMCELYLNESISEKDLHKKLFELCEESNFETDLLMAEGKSIINYDTLQLLKKIFKAHTKKKRKYSLEGWLTVENFLKKYKYVGRYDVLVNEMPEKVVIVDFKTSKKWKGKYNPDWMQLYMYAYLLYSKMMDKGELPHKIQCVLWFLRTNEVFVRDVKEIDMITALQTQEEAAKEIIKNYENGEFSPKKNNFCSGCMFKKECSIWN